jgi:uncharacterized protein YndB with AHSA1/START domain
MTWLWWTLGGLAGLVAVAWGVGMLLPKGHVASRTLRLNQPPEEVWRVLTDYAAMPSWRGDLRSVERLPDRDGHGVWKEILKNGFEIPLETTEESPPQRLVRRITDPKLPFGGRWIHEIRLEAGGSELTLTEEGEVYQPIFRLVSRFTSQAATIEQFLRSLAAKFGEEPRISGPASR